MKLDGKNELAVGAALTRGQREGVRTAEPGDEKRERRKGEGSDVFGCGSYDFKRGKWLKTRGGEEMGGR